MYKRGSLSPEEVGAKCPLCEWTQTTRDLHLMAKRYRLHAKATHFDKTSNITINLLDVSFQGDLVKLGLTRAEIESDVANLTKKEAIRALFQ